MGGPGRAGWHGFSILQNHHLHPSPVNLFNPLSPNSQSNANSPFNLQPVICGTVWRILAGDLLLESKFV